ncbi:Histone-lysine N-methyltransferase SETDB2 [Channa argus]|uniref:Histone-lysine N-methyltransferase SETDB2 n=1 Tax=Channa argus TaxID=215402 RepID=A0A6G1PDJ0_CHAAH|nr:Histone-lysine N-methyltransferase SETDB2 [Channa argus]KAK2917279.1 hypothetical protein Q8A73_004025 [Channa argus]
MEEGSLDPQDVERAKTFWAEEDVDQVFNRVFVYLDHLKRVLKKNTATDKEFVQGLKLLESLDLSVPVPSQDSCVVEVVVGSGELLLAGFSQHSSSLCSNGLSSPCSELLPPLAPVQLQYQLHSCCKACLTSVPQSKSPFWGQNPLKVPLLCGFKRLSALPLVATRGSGSLVEVMTGPVEEDGVESLDVVYKAPCGQSLRNHDDVMHFLSATESYHILQVDFFTFNPSVLLDPPSVTVPLLSEVDLSRGAEPTPVQLCPGEGGARPPEFRYRKARWPHGCFLSSGPTLFSVCCDCTDGCTSGQQCACIAMTRGGRNYTHHRLTEPVPSGLYECGPWCGCDRVSCQNRVVQRGIRVRLQVFQTEERGWGVRCRDDLDRGTFVCIFAGVVLRRVQSPVEPLPPKLSRSDLPSDDEVEVVTEWLAPPVLEGSSNLLETLPLVSPSSSPPLYVPVIQRPTDTNASQDRDKTVLMGGEEPASPLAGDQSQPQEKAAASLEAPNGRRTGMNKQRSLKRAAKVEDVYLLDATKEGNVSRFINHSCQPNLFIQNVFTDTHEPGFPVIAFFTSRVVKAGTELTWDYSADMQTASLRKQEVPCLCGSSGCQGQFTVVENLCGVCEGDGVIKAH